MNPTQRAILTTGLAGLDGVLHGVAAGDNIVWQVQDVEDYCGLVKPYAEAARAAGARLVYFRFAGHRPLLRFDFGAEIYTPSLTDGFEAFVEHVHAVIEKVGRGAMYVFDCLSSLAEAWQADQLLGNFFMLICPRLFDLETVTYFAVYRNRHTVYAMRAIAETTQWMLDVFGRRGRLYIRPLKVQHRSKDAMNLIHAWEGEEFLPVVDSAIVSEILADSEWPGLQADTRAGYWHRHYVEARHILQAREQGAGDPTREQMMFRRLAGMLLAEDPHILDLAQRYLTLDDLVAIRDRQIGIGRIGGKAAGMLLARAILRREAPDLTARLETHDSFYVGAEVFHTFLVQNGLWWARRGQRNPDVFLKDLEDIRSRILTGPFPDYVLDQFAGMLDYFGEWPFIVRSSSLLEDAYGNSFAGKYESIFCVNRGPREARMSELLDAVRRVYASAMGEEALQYRLRRGLLDRDEQMALLVMRVSGAGHGRWFYPQCAGVGLSFNPYPWDPRIDPKAGVVRLVFGLGTRAVDRADDDYTRLVALNAPHLRPETNFDDICDNAQRRMDALDLETNRFTSAHFLDILNDARDLPLDLFLSEQCVPDQPSRRALTFDGLLRETGFVDDQREILAQLELAYGHPVETEFALNVLRDGSYRIHLLQCRTLQVRRQDAAPLPAAPPPASARRVEAHGAVIGLSRDLPLDLVIHVRPAAFASLPMQDRHEIARVIGRVNRAIAGQGWRVLLLGPGRWGTRDPALGIPVHYSEINQMSVLCEIVAMRDTLVPDVSLGTHFLSELVEMDILYFALFPRREDNRLDEAWLTSVSNRLTEFATDAGAWTSVVHVANGADLAGGGAALRILADALAQKVCVYTLPVRQ